MLVVERRAAGAMADSSETSFGLSSSAGASTGGDTTDLRVGGITTKVTINRRRALEIPDDVQPVKKRQPSASPGAAGKVIARRLGSQPGTIERAKAAHIRTSRNHYLPLVRAGRLKP